MDWNYLSNFADWITLPDEIAYTLNSKHCLLELILNKLYTYVQMHVYIIIRKIDYFRGTVHYLKH